MSNVQDLAAFILAGRSCSVEMPAGHGKTETIAELAILLLRKQRSVLILTHTNAAVRSLRKRFWKSDVDTQNGIAIRTIDAFTKNWGIAFPTSCGFETRSQVESVLDFQSLEAGLCIGIEQNHHIRRIMSQSYDAILVDEYQDCGPNQLALLSCIHESCSMPLALFRDQLQQIFVVDEEQNQDILPQDIWSRFPAVDMQSRPWRWINANQDLGLWLTDIRAKIIANQYVSYEPYLQKAKPSERQFFTYTIQSLASAYQSLILIEAHRPRAMNLARNLGIDFQLQEKKNHVEFQPVSKAIQEGHAGTVVAKLLMLVKESSTGFGNLMTESQINGIAANTVPNFRAADKLELKQLLQDTLGSLSPASLGSILGWLLKSEDIRVFRRPLLRELMKVFEAMDAHEGSFEEALQRVRYDQSYIGTNLDAFTITSPWLFKGMQTSNVILVRPEVMSCQAFYVSITRATDQLWIFSETSGFQADR